jgi:hypothetical protein
LQVLSELAQSTIDPWADRTWTAPESFGDLVRRELMVEAEHQHGSMVEGKLLQRDPQTLVVGAVIDRVRAGDRTDGRGAPLPGSVAGTVTAAVQHHAVEVRTWLGELVPSAVDLDERVMDEISRVVSIADEERRATNLPRELRVVEPCEPVTAIARHCDHNEVRLSRPRTPRDRDHHPLPRMGTPY